MNKTTKQNKKKWTAENQEKAITAGIIETIVKVINAQVKNADLCKSIITFIWQMIHDGKKKKKAHNY